MNAVSLDPTAVAEFLKENPSFFRDHASIFADLQVPHPHETRAISLGERQILTLRARNKDLEWKLAGLLHNANGNEKITISVHDWCCRMLAEEDPTRLPEHIADSLRQIFELPSVALRVWGLAALPEGEYNAEVSSEVRLQADELAEPYCGPYTQQAAAQLLDETPTSLAIMALRPHAEAPAFGVLVLGSDDPERYTADMATDFLGVIARLASAGLSRLYTPDADLRA